MTPEPIASWLPATLVISTTEGCTALVTLTTLCCRLFTLEDNVMAGAEVAPITTVRAEAPLPLAMAAPVAAPAPRTTKSASATSAADQHRRRGRPAGGVPSTNGGIGGMFAK